MAENDFQRRDGTSEVKRGLWNIDLNDSPPEDSGSESPPAENSGGVREMRQMAAVVGFEFGENRGAIGVHFSRGETAGGEGAIAVTGYGKGKGKEEEEVGEGNSRYWDALLEAASEALRAYEESARGEEEKAGNRRRRASREAEPREEAAARRTRKKVNDGGEEWWNDGAVVARSTRRRSVAMPSKYKDSVLHAAAVVVAEARCSRRRSG